MDDAAQDRLDGTGYVATKLIGKGGMGAVYEAQHRESGDVVVVKLLHEGSADPQLVERMRIEAQVVSRLDHPHIVRVLGYGTTPLGEPFIVMERLVGRTLTAELRARKILPLGEAAVAAGALLRALHYAHERGVIHRDVKLDNVFLHETSEGRVLKLLDFGIAKLKEPHLGVAPSQHPTQEGYVLGTIRYAAPEQLMSQAVDARTDVYAAAVAFFALVAGRRPFEQRDQLDVMRAQLVEPAPLLSSVAKQPIPPAVDAVVARALAKRPGGRFPSAAAFAAALREAASLPERAHDATADLPHAAMRQTSTARAPAVDDPVVDAGRATTVASPGASRSRTLASPTPRAEARQDNEARAGRASAPWWFTLGMAFIVSVGLLLIALLMAQRLGYVGWQRGQDALPLNVVGSLSWPGTSPS